MTEEKKPTFIQIDDEIREMTPEELKNYEALSAHAVCLADAE